MEHCLVIADDICRTRDFYRDSLGMEVGYRPPLSFPGYWLYLNGVPCIHIAEWKSYEEYTSGKNLPMTSKALSTGPVDHLAFNASGFEEMRARFGWSAAGLPLRACRRLQRLAWSYLPGARALMARAANRSDSATEDGA